MFLKQLLGLLGGGYFFDPVSEVSLMVEKFEDGLTGLPRFFVSHNREIVVANPDD